MAQVLAFEKTGTMHKNPGPQGVTAEVVNAQPPKTKVSNAQSLAAKSALAAIPEGEEQLRTNSGQTGQKTRPDQFALLATRKAPPPLPSSERINGEVVANGFGELGGQVAIYSSVSARHIANYDLDINTTWASLKTSLQVRLFRGRPEMLTYPIVIFVEPTEGTFDLQESVLAFMRTNGIHRIVVAIDAAACVPKAPASACVPRAPPANQNQPKAPPAYLPDVPASTRVPSFDLEDWVRWNPEPASLFPPTRG